MEIKFTKASEANEAKRKHYTELMRKVIMNRFERYVKSVASVDVTLDIRSTALEIYDDYLKGRIDTLTNIMTSFKHRHVFELHQVKRWRSTFLENHYDDLPTRLSNHFFNEICLPKLKKFDFDYSTKEVSIASLDFSHTVKANVVANKAYQEKFLMAVIQTYNNWSKFATQVELALKATDILRANISNRQLTSWVKDTPVYYRSLNNARLRITEVKHGKKKVEVIPYKHQKPHPVTMYECYIGGLIWDMSQQPIAEYLEY